MGEPAEAGLSDPHARARDAFLRLLGFVYLAAFLSLWVQAEGLIGSRGILPFRELLDLARARLGPSRYCSRPGSWPCSWPRAGSGGGVPAPRLCSSCGCTAGCCSG